MSLHRSMNVSVRCAATDSSGLQTADKQATLLDGRGYKNVIWGAMSANNSTDVILLSSPQQSVVMSLGRVVAGLVITVLNVITLVGFLREKESLVCCLLLSFRLVFF